MGWELGVCCVEGRMVEGWFLYEQRERFVARMGLMILSRMHCLSGAGLKKALLRPSDRLSFFISELLSVAGRSFPCPH